MCKKYFSLHLSVFFLLFLTFQTQAAPGDLDPTFGTGGYVTTGSNVDFVNPARDLAIQNDGKIVVIKRDGNGGKASVARYNPNGTLDTTFGVNGIATTQASRFIFFVESVVIQNDGKILVAGRFDSNRGSYGYDWVLIRYNPDGSLDSTFDGDGILEFAINSPNGGKLKILKLDNGKFYVVGTSRFDYVVQGSPNQAASITVVKFNSNGSKDTSFNNNGVAVNPYFYPLTQQLTFARHTYADSAVLQQDGKIVIVSHIDFGCCGRTAITRLNSDGVPDASFGNQPEGNAGWNYVKIRELSIPIEIPADIAIQTDGKFVVVGRAYYNNSPIDEFTVLRFGSDGFLDTTFDSDGIVNTDIRDGSDEANAVVIQPDGKIVAVGESRKNSAPSSIDFASVRYNPDGSLDNSFGTNGIAIYNLNSGVDGANAAKLQPDGKIVAVGSPSFTVARILTDSTTIQNRTKFDFDGDGKSDVSVFRPSNGAWYINQSQSGFTGITFGAGTDQLAPADFDGDGKTDVAVFRNGNWYYLQSSNNAFVGVSFGQAGDLPRPADFDGDNKADINVFRPSNGAWYRLNSSNGSFFGIAFGQNGDKPLVADFDGDNKSDIAVFRPSNGAFYSLNSSNGAFRGTAFGFGTDIPTMGDFDGDNKTDIAVFRPSNGAWYRYNSSTGAFVGVTFGQNGDIPVAADYDGDGKSDIAVFRPSNGAWYYLKSSNGSFVGFGFGFGTDKPIPAAFQ